jgi:DNA end-binding protein Ku
MARGIWKGTLSFGLVSIGVELHTAEKSERLDLDLIDKRDMGRIGYQKINKSTGKVVEQDDIVRGYEVSKGRYVVLTPAELKEANPKSTQTVDVIGFIDAGTIPLIYHAKPYVIAPLKGSEKPYVLFREALVETGQVALAQVVISTRQYMATVFPNEGTLVVQLLRYEAELKTRAEVGMETLPTPGRAVRPEELKMAKQLIESMATKWEPGEYNDEYRDDLMATIKKRAKKGADREVQDGDAPKHAKPDDGKVLDLMAALRKSIDEQGGTSKRASRKTSKRASPKRSSRKSA